MSDPEKVTPERARAPGTFKVGTIAGSDVLISSSWFLVAGLIAVIMAPRVEQVQPGLGAGKYVAGLAFAVVLYLSVLLHEASHAVMARRYGFAVHSITLHFLGGMTAIEGESRTPREEFGIAVVGPLTSLGVGAAAIGLWFVTPDGLLLMAVEGLAAANLLVGVLNLVPGLPLDGGRVLKAFVWRLSGSTHTGTIAAGWGGRITAIAALLWPLAQEAALRRPRRRARLRAVRRDRRLPVDRRDRSDGVRALPATVAGTRGAGPRPADVGRARRPAPVRGDPARPRSTGGGPDHHDERRPPDRRGQRARAPGHPGGSAPLGSRSPRSPAPSTTA